MSQIFFVGVSTDTVRPTAKPRAEAIERTGVDMPRANGLKVGIMALPPSRNVGRTYIGRMRRLWHPLPLETGSANPVRRPKSAKRADLDQYETIDSGPISVPEGGAAVGPDRPRRAFPGIIAGDASGAGRIGITLKHEIAKLVAEPTLSNAESDHRIANHLAMLAGYIRLKSSELARREGPPDASDLGNLIRAIVAQMDAISDLHRILSTQGTLNTMDLSVPLSRICAAMQIGVAGEVNIVGSFEKGCELAPRAVLPVTQICTEVITNAIKHGCNSNGQGNIRVSCGKTSAGTILVEISDNGQGQTCNRHAIGSNGLGLRLIDALVQQVDGRMEYLSSAQGLTVRLRLPAALM